MNKKSQVPSKEAMEAVAPIFPEVDGSDEKSDLDLVAECQAGDSRAFDELVTRYRGRIYGMIVNMIRNETEAWDLAQEAFIKAWKALPKFEGKSSFYTWLYRITHNVTYDWMRKRKISPGTELDDLVQQSGAIEPGAPTIPHQDESPDRRLENVELGDRIKDALAQLSEDHRAVVLLKEVEGLKYREIAETLECSMGTVMSRLFHARKKLQELLGDLYGGASETQSKTKASS